MLKVDKHCLVKTIVRLKGFKLFHQKETLKKLTNEESVKLSKIKRLELENSLLTDNIDKDFVDQLIRDKLMLGKKGESTYIIVNNDN